MEKKPKVLFLSTGNSTRSQMAEGFLRVIAGDQFIAASAGIEPGSLNPIAAEVMKEVGIDISPQESKDLTQLLKDDFRYVITVSDSARERAPIFPSTTNLLHWNLIDPASAHGSDEDIKEAFRRVRDEIRVKIHYFVDETFEKSKTVTQGTQG